MSPSPPPPKTQPLLHSYEQLGKDESEKSPQNKTLHTMHHTTIDPTAITNKVTQAQMECQPSSSILMAFAQKPRKPLPCIKNQTISPIQ